MRKGAGDRGGRPSDPWACLDATAQAALVRSGAASAEELVVAACERVERVDPRLGAVPIRLFEAARSAARAVPRDAPFAGVPFLMKDVGARQAGQPYTAGNRALRDAGHVAERDTPLGAAFRALGLVTVGNSSTPEFGLQSNTWPLAYGPTRNPWDPARCAGGSSGGACAAVAAGLVPAAHASDGAGSIRIPAAWCGLPGLKPSRDRVIWRHAGKGRPDVEFLVARSLRDTATALGLLLAPGASPGRFEEALRRPPRALRVGLCTRSPSGGPTHPDCCAAVESAGAALQAGGHAVEKAAPAALFEYEERALHGAAFGFLEYRTCLEDLEERLGRAVTSDDVEPFLWSLARHEPSQGSAQELERAVAWTRSWAARTLAWFEDFDLLLTPTVCEPAPTLESLDPERHDPLELLDKMVLHMAFTEPWNATGQPAMTLPFGLSAEGLPVGVQLVAAPDEEERLLSAAAVLEAQAPESGGRPRVHA